MNTNIKYRDGRSQVRWWLLVTLKGDYATAKAFWRLNKATIAMMTDRMGNIV